MGAGIRYYGEDVTLLVEAHLDYLWRWFGRDVPVAGLEIGFLIPLGSSDRGPVAVVAPPDTTAPGPVQVVQ